jgi:hypothetical protein
MDIELRQVTSKFQSNDKANSRAKTFSQFTIPVMKIDSQRRFQESQFSWVSQGKSVAWSCLR